MIKKIVVAAMLITLLIISCKHEIPIPGSSNIVTSVTCSPDTVYFTNTILPLITSSCAGSGCHDAASHEGGYTLNNYSGIMRIVRPYNPGESKLYKVIVTTNSGDRMPPPPLPPMSASDIAAIQKWINQGARNNSCLSSCDSTQFTFTATILPMMNTYCKGCHNPASAGGGIDLSTYNSIRSAASSGRLLGSIKHTPGYVSMPQNGPKLSVCQIWQVERWIQGGMLNN